MSVIWPNRAEKELCKLSLIVTQYFAVVVIVATVSILHLVLVLLCCCLSGIKGIRHVKYCHCNSQKLYF